MKVSVQTWSREPQLTLTVGSCVRHLSVKLCRFRCGWPSKCRCHQGSQSDSNVSIWIKWRGSHSPPSSYIVLAVLCFVLAFCFPTFFKHLNEPLRDFQNRDRMEGRQQEEFFAKHATEGSGDTVSYSGHPMRVEDIDDKV